MARLTLDALIESKQSVYVINESGTLTGTKGVIHLAFIDQASGKTKPFTIPRTWLPVCLSEAIPEATLKNSYDLRGMLQKGYLRLVEPKEAEKLLDTPEAKDELQRLRAAERMSRNLNNSVGSGTEEFKVVGPENSTRISNGLEPVSAEDRVNARVRDILLRVETGDLQPRAGVAELRSFSTDLTPEDASYVISASQHPQLKKFGQQLLAEMNTEVEDPFTSKSQKAGHQEMDAENELDVDFEPKK